MTRKTSGPVVRQELPRFTSKDVATPRHLQYAPHKAPPQWQRRGLRHPEAAR